MLNPRFWVVLSMIVVTAVSRLLPHPWNFSPVAGLALFSGAHLKNKKVAFLIPLGALFLSDLVIGLYRDILFVYLSFAIVVGLGFWVRKNKTVGRVAGCALVGSVLHFFITNMAVWVMYDLYPKTVAGLFMCFTMALPYFQNTLLGDAFFTAILFGTFAVAEQAVPLLKKQSVLA